MALDLSLDDDDNELLLIHEIARQVKICFDRRIAHLGLTRSQWRVLGVLRRNPGIKQSSLAEMIEIEPMSLCRLLDRMEKNDWLQRIPDAKDRRANALVLTAKVDSILAELKTASTQLRQETLKGFQTKSYQNFLVDLKNIKANVGHMLSEGEEKAL